MRKAMPILPILLLFAVLLFSGCATTDMAYSNRGFEELSRNNYEKAEEYLQKALALNPNNPYAILNMGAVYQNTGRYEKACQMYDKLIELDAKVTAERSTQDWAQGKQLVNIAKRNYDMAYSNLAYEELARNNYLKAEEYLQKALALNPDNPYALLNMGVVYQNTGRPEKAREMYNKVIELRAKAGADKGSSDGEQELRDKAKKNLNAL